MRESWTDGRLDDLNGRVDQRFDRVEADMRALRVEAKTEFMGLRGDMKAGFEHMDERFDALYRLLIQFCGLLLAALIGLIATLTGVFVTQL